MFIGLLSLLAMLAVGGSVDVIVVPGNVLQYRNLPVSKVMLGKSVSALTCPVLPYEHPEDPEKFRANGLARPTKHAYLLYN